MFVQLEDLIRKNPLLITVSSEGENLRVSVTQTPSNSKVGTTISPVSLVATAIELDEGLADALLAWKNPKRSLMEQAVAAANPDTSCESAKATVGSEPTTKVRGKPGPKPKPAASAPADDTPAAAPAPADDAPAAAPAPADDAPAAAPAPAATSAPAEEVATSTKAGSLDTINSPPPGATLGPANDAFTLDIF